MDFSILPHGTLAAFGFFGKKVSAKSFLMGDFPGAGYFEPLLGT